MRLGKFESAGKEPLGTGKDKRVFVNPKDESKVISVEREDAWSKDTVRQLKGRYYLTKIVHIIFPKNIPDVYQAGESVEGKKTVDAERVPHTPGHALLQEVTYGGINLGMEPIRSAKKQTAEELGGEMEKLNSELHRIGLVANIDTTLSNYTKDEKGNVYYLETFKPWQVDSENKEFKYMMFDEEKLRDAIAGIPDEAARKKCERYLDRILALAEEERKELKERK